MDLAKQIDIKNMHHAYLVEGKGDLVVEGLINFLEKNNIKCRGNSSFYKYSIQTFKIDDARELKFTQSENSSQNEQGESLLKIFVIEAFDFTGEAQNALLKIFEEPTKNTVFFVITQNTASIFPTLKSRMVFVSANTPESIEMEIEAKKFLSDVPQGRINFVADFMKGAPDEDTSDQDRLSFKNKTIGFLDSLEYCLYQELKKSKDKFFADTVNSFEEIIRCRKYIMGTGASIKMLFEHLALILPKRYNLEK